MMAASDIFGATLTAITDPALSYLRKTGLPMGPDLETGEVAFDLPEEARRVLGQTASTFARVGYSSPQGQADLRNHYLRITASVEGSSAVDCLISAGGKEALWLSISHAMSRREGPVFVPSPGWAPYSIWVKAAGRRAVTYDPTRLLNDSNYSEVLLTGAEDLGGVLILNYPHNPTGLIATQSDLNRIGRSAALAGSIVVADEVYRSFDEDGASMLTGHELDPEDLYVVDSCSKWLAGAGFRVGFLVASKSNVAAITTFRSSYASCTSVYSQAAVLALLNDVSFLRWMEDVRKVIRKNAHEMREALEIRGVSVDSLGGMYLWCQNPNSPGTMRTGALAARTAPGESFGSDRHYRVCVARPQLDISSMADAILMGRQLV